MPSLNKRLIKKVKRQVPWVEHIINNEKTAGDLNVDSSALKIQTHEGSLCIICRGNRMLCGKSRCSAILKLYSLLKTEKIVNSERLVGSSPPGVFIGRMGYPHVYAGPLVPPVLGDTSVYDAPEQWLGTKVDEIIVFRTNLVRAKFRVNVTKPFQNQNFVEKTLEITMAKEPVETEVVFKNKPSGNLLLDGEVQPMGPSAVVRNMEIETAKFDSKIEKAYGDGDLRAEDAVMELFRGGVPVSKIQRTFSVGAFGLKNQRRIVPTRWSITAVDSAISRDLIDEQVKGKPIINEYMIYEFNYLGNRFLVLLTPSSWRYEWIEAWYPGTVWNPKSQNIAMGADWEGYHGRKTYASIGGCYYAVRLAVAEFLSKIGRQAGVIAMREIYPSFIVPLGVWINRESVREAFKNEPSNYSSLKDALDHVRSRFAVSLDNWIQTSTLLKDFLYQERLTKYLRK
ncbi:MAG: Nre family DNA repair protein [Candidatus Bathyarchaeia archaeon]